jgi:hypothetical protein
MIGERYWSTGIMIAPTTGGWAVSLQFYDDGFAQDDATEGTMRVRYLVADAQLEHALRVLRADAERLGIRFGVGPELRPTVYAEDDENETARRRANQLADALGWTPAYRLQETSR